MASLTVDPAALAIEVERAVSAGIARRHERRYGSLVGRSGVTMAAACAAVERAAAADNARRYAARERVEALTGEPVEFVPAAADAVAVLREAEDGRRWVDGHPERKRTGDGDPAADPATRAATLVAAANAPAA